ncbi:hypothetical protein PR048_021682 [Dryococelus australis]|uniref:Peroxin-19 n=1 Tax=Dryococelus australis TaxID=614101 RepID=A0ABQ9GYV9_9NEOP|nr:hypothetical protein PR048_021682 [Dryococelus australis]
MADKNIKDSSDSYDDEMAALLDDALSDFEKPGPCPVATSSVEKPASSAVSEDVKWTEEFLKQATANLEQSMGPFLEAIDSDEGLIPEQLTAHLQKLAEVAVKSASGEDESKDDADFSAAISQTLKSLSEGRENLNNFLPEDELKNMLGNLGLGDGSDESVDFMRFMQQILQCIISKDILYQPLKELADKYPEWLEENESRLEPAELQRHKKHSDLILEVCNELEQESENDSADMKKQRFDKVMNLMQKMSDCGQLPKELIGSVGNISEQLTNQLPPGFDPSQCCLM